MRLRLLHGSQRATPTLLIVALFVVGAAAALTIVGGPLAVAAEEAPPADDLDLPDDAPPAAAAAPAADAPPPAAGEGEGAAEEQNYLSWMVGALGWFFSLVFLALSFTTVALFVMNLLTARRGKRHSCRTHRRVRGPSQREAISRRLRDGESR